MDKLGKFFSGNSYRNGKTDKKTEESEVILETPLLTPESSEKTKERTPKRRANKNRPRLFSSKSEAHIASRFRTNSQRPLAPMDELIEPPSAKGNSIDLTTLMDSIGVAKKDQPRVSSHKGWKKAQELGPIPTSQSGRKLLTTGMDDQVRTLFSALWSEGQARPAFNLLSMCEPPSSRIVTLEAVSETIEDGQAFTKDLFGSHATRLLNRCLEQTADDLGRQGDLKGLERLIRICDGQQRKGVLARLLLDPLLPFSKVSSALPAAIKLESVWKKAVSMAIEDRDPAHGLHCLACQCADLDRLVNEHEIKWFAYRESLANALDNLGDEIAPDLAGKIRERLEPATQSPLSLDLESSLFSHGVAVSTHIEVPDVKPISGPGRLPGLMKMAVEYANSLPSEQRAQLGRELHGELDLLLQEGAITDRDYSAVLEIALGWTREV